MRGSLLAAMVCAAALNGCDTCYNVACDEPDVAHINGLHFSFDPASFLTEELTRAYVLRFNPGDFETPLDTLHIGPLMTDSTRSFAITQASFRHANDFTGFVYGIYDNAHENAFIVAEVATEGYHPNDCCCCYRNTRKTFRLNGIVHDRTGSTDPLVLKR